MASRVMHLAIANEIMKQVHIEDVERFRLGIILPDAYKHNIQSATDSHLKYTTEDGTKKTYKLAWFRETYGEKMKEFIEKNLGWLSVLFLILLIGGFALLKFL